MDQWMLNSLFDRLDVLLGGVARANDFQLVKITADKQVWFEHKATKLRVVLDYPTNTLKLPSRPSAS
jgi:hypothetical protein